MVIPDGAIEVFAICHQDIRLAVPIDVCHINAPHSTG